VRDSIRVTVTGIQAARPGDLGSIPWSSRDLFLHSIRPFSDVRTVSCVVGAQGFFRGLKSAGT
jgi:hypothetical protein